MPDRKPRRMIGVPRSKPLSKPPWQWRAEDMAWGAAELVAVGALWLVLVAIETLAVFALVYLAIEYALPWVVDVVMDAVEQRD